VRRPDPEQLLDLARAGSGPALGRLLQLYRNYLALLARLQIGRRTAGLVAPAAATTAARDRPLAHRPCLPPSRQTKNGRLPSISPRQISIALPLSASSRVTPPAQVDVLRALPGSRAGNPRPGLTARVGANAGRNLASRWARSVAVEGVSVGEAKSDVRLGKVTENNTSRAAARDSFAQRPVPTWPPGSLARPACHRTE
jgi:hypothetical protein